jgi:CDP-glucose 4,6-dehydratase
VHCDMVNWKDVSGDKSGPYESGLLKLNCDKALHFLQWHAVMDFEATVKMTAEWYRMYYQDSSTIRSVTEQQIMAYTAFAKKQKLKWAQ